MSDFVTPFIVRSYLGQDIPTTDPGDGSAWKHSSGAVVLGPSFSPVISDISGLQTALDAKANDASVVHIAGAENVDGQKTFTDGLTINNTHSSTAYIFKAQYFGSSKFFIDNSGRVDTYNQFVVNGSGGFVNYGAAAKIISDYGTKIRNAADTADAPITAGNIIGSGYIIAGTEANYLRMRYDAGYPKIETETGSITLQGSGFTQRWTSAYTDIAMQGQTYLSLGVNSYNTSYSNSGFRSRNYADTADAPITAGAAAFSGGATITGGGVTGTGGVQIGSHSASYGGVWASGLTPSTSNYGLLLGASETYLNSPVFMCLQTGGQNRWAVLNAGHFEPGLNNTYDLGTSGNRIRNLYTISAVLGNSGTVTATQYGQLYGTWVGAADTWSLSSITGTFPAGLTLGKDSHLYWSGTADYSGARDLGLARNAGTVLEINNGTPVASGGNYADLKAKYGTFASGVYAPFVSNNSGALYLSASAGNSVQLQVGGSTILTAAASQLELSTFGMKFANPSSQLIVTQVYDVSLAAWQETTRHEASAAGPRWGVFGNAALQQTGGVATAGATYGGTEQTMLQKAYDCLRTFGLLN